MYVVDASVWVSHFAAADLNHLDTRAWFKQVRSAGELIFGPVLLLPEVAGAISRRTQNPEFGRQTIAGLERMPRLRLSPLEDRFSEFAARIAAQLRIKGSDAVYVALAASMGIPLVTWDREQRQRATRAVDARTPSELLQRTP